jgi:hypothetical protein
MLCTRMKLCTVLLRRSQHRQQIMLGGIPHLMLY